MSTLSLPARPRTALGIAALNLLLMLAIVTSVQFIAKVYAAAFTLSSSTTETKPTFRVILGDIDNDGDLDWVAANVKDTNVNNDVYKNNGSASFTQTSTFSTSPSHEAMKGVDIDSDGDLDMFGCHTSETSKHVNNGNGAFTSYSLVSSADGCDGVVTGDFNGDGYADFIFLSQGFSPGSSRIYINDGHGNFTGVTSTFGPSSIDATAADFDSDGDLDLVFHQDLADNVVYKNSGTGAFIPSATLTNAMGPNAVGDLDADGDIDIVVAESTGPTPYLNNGLGTSFTAGTSFGAVNTTQDIALGDVDHDGDLDAIIAGSHAAAGTNGGNEIWLNNGSGVFSQTGTPTEEDDFTYQVAMGDLDNDGDLDYVAGNTETNGGETGRANRVYLNDHAATSANVAPTAPGSLTATVVSPTPRNGSTFVEDSGNGGTVAWNNESDAETENGNVASTQTAGAGTITTYLKATGFNFSIPTNATIAGVKVEIKKQKGDASAVTNDHEVKLVKGGTVSGNNKADTTTAWPAALTYVTYGGSTDLWGLSLSPSDINASNFGMVLSAQNNGGSVSTMGSVDHIRITVYYTGVHDVRLSWGSGSDSVTSTRMLQYQVRVGTGASAHNIVSGRTTSPNWVNAVKPNGQSRTMVIKNIACGKTYYWDVTVVDTGFKTATTSEQTFTLSSGCTIPGSSPPPPVGGGLPASYFRTNNPVEEAAAHVPGTVTVTAFQDLDANGKRVSHERVGFKGLLVTASGRTLDELSAVEFILPITDKGTATFSLPPSNAKGYHFSYDPNSHVVKGFVPTNKSFIDGIVVKSGDKKGLLFGLRREELLSYRPCLTLGQPEADEIRGIDAFVLFQRLQNSFGTKIMKGKDLETDLVGRKMFFTLLQRTQCVPIVKDLKRLTKLLKGFAFIDLPLDLRIPDAQLLYSLLAAKSDVARVTTLGKAADLKTPITRREAIRAVVTLLPAAKPVTEGTLPTDLAADDPLVPDFLRLQKLGILPESFLPILGANQGIDPGEAAILLMRAAFVGGKIHVTAQRQTRPVGKIPAPAPTFLKEIPALKLRSCFVKDGKRDMDVSFTDVLPGDKQYFDLRELLTWGTRNSDDKVLWLLPVTYRPTETGIIRGQTRARLEEPVSILEVLRDLLVLTCLPQPTKKDVLSGAAAAAGIFGTPDARVNKDRISDLPRDDSFASRVLYRAQDHIREFNLSLFTFAEHLLRLPARSPASGMNMEEASELLASALLMIQTRTQAMTPQTAEKAFPALVAAIRRDLLGKEVNWRDLSVLRTTPLTRGMLVQFLATVVQNRKTVPYWPIPEPIPLGELWWERIRS